MPASYEGNHWEIDGNRLSAKEVARSYNKLEGENTRLLRESANLEREKADLRTELAEKDNPNGSSLNLSKRDLIVAGLALLAVLVIVNLVTIFGWLGGILSAELTVGWLILLILLVWFGIWLYGRFRDDQLKKSVSQRLGIYGRGNKQEPSEEESDQKQESFWDDLNTRFKTTFGIRDRGGHS